MSSEANILVKGSPIDLLVVKLEAWMVQQPEWLHIVNMPRPQRRAAMKALANRLYTIPIMDGVNTIPRTVRRKASKQLGKAALTGVLTEQVKEALARAADGEVLADVAEFSGDDDPSTFEGSVPIIGEVDEPDIVTTTVEAEEVEQETEDAAETS